MSILLLPNQCYDFPDPTFALQQRDDGLVCATKKLTPRHLLNAYPKGIFPWLQEGDYFFWFPIAPRAVLFPEQLHLAKSLKKALRQKTFKVTINQAFAQVIGHCAKIARAGQKGSWISQGFQRAYTELHQQQAAHSVECWYPSENGDWQLAGGFYGVQIGSVFFGESMFALQPDASKIAFACAVPYLQKCGIKMIDCQQNTAHLARFGSELLSFTKFQQYLTWTTQPLQQEIKQNETLYLNLIDA